MDAKETLATLLHVVLDLRSRGPAGDAAADQLVAALKQPAPAKNAEAPPPTMTPEQIKAAGIEFGRALLADNPDADTFCQEGTNAGKPGVCPSGSAEPTATAKPAGLLGKLSSIVGQAAKLPAAVFAKAKGVAQKTYTNAEAKYGKTYARLIVGSFIAGLPLPGGTLLPAPIIAIAALHRKLAGWGQAQAPVLAGAHAETFCQVGPNSGKPGVCPTTSTSGRKPMASAMPIHGTPTTAAQQLAAREHETSLRSQDARRRAGLAHAEDDPETFCGGAGSKKPGPCPKGRAAAHVVMRAHANAAKARAAKAKPGTEKHAQATAHAARLTKKAGTLEHQARVAAKVYGKPKGPAGAKAPGKPPAKPAAKKPTSKPAAKPTDTYRLAPEAPAAPAAASPAAKVANKPYGKPVAERLASIHEREAQGRTPFVDLLAHALRMNDPVLKGASHAAIFSHLKSQATGRDHGQTSLAIGDGPIRKALKDIAPEAGELTLPELKKLLPHMNYQPNVPGKRTMEPGEKRPQTLPANAAALLATATKHAEVYRKFTERCRRFCQEGENKGKPGVCPGPETATAVADPPAPAASAATPAPTPPAAPQHPDKPAAPQASPAAREQAEKWLAKATLPAELKQKYTHDMAVTLDKMPPKCRAEALEAFDPDFGGKVTFHADLPAVRAQLEKETGRKEKSKVGGFVSYRDGDITARMHIDGGDETESAQGIYAHELGHAVDVGRKYSEDPKWKAAWKSELFNGKTLLSTYARTSATEGFAELHRALCQRGVEATKAAFPKCCAFMKAKGLI